MHGRLPGIIDIHAHILPGVDDGARDMEESVRMLQEAAEQGITGVIATPHDSRRRVPSGYPALLAELQERIQDRCPGFTLWLGQETCYHEGLAERMKAGQAFTMAGSRYVLIEFDPGVSYHQLVRGLRQLTEKGYWPILAHIERYRCLKESGTGELRSMGCKLQMNYESLAGSWLSAEVRWCRRQVTQGAVDFLATDMHRLDHRPPRTQGAFSWLEGHVSGEDLLRLVRVHAVSVVRGKPF